MNLSAYYSSIATLKVAVVVNSTIEEYKKNTSQRFDAMYSLLKVRLDKITAMSIKKTGVNHLQVQTQS